MTTAKREDRRVLFEEEASKHSIKFEYLYGVELYRGMGDCNKHQVGLKLTFAEIVWDALRNGYGSVFCFEDDATFHPDFDAIFDAFMGEVPEWDMVFLGANNQGEKQRVSQHVYTSTKWWCTHAFGMRSAVFGEVLKLNLFGPNDVVWNHMIYPNYRVYICDPHIVMQRDGFSDSLGEWLNAYDQTR